MYPDFIGIGAQKAGTTWLYQNLRAHPDIWMPKEKEIHYFDEKAKPGGGLLAHLRGDSPADKRWRRQLGLSLKALPRNMSTEDLAWSYKYFFGSPNDHWYASLFEPGRGRITGETTPDYAILSKASIAHVHSLMPEAKIIFMMRNPIERPWSVINMGLRSRGENPVSISRDEFEARLDGKRKRRMTSYLRTLRKWSAFYPEDRIFVGFLEDVHLFPEKLLKSLYDFLEVPVVFDERFLRLKVNSGQQSTMPTRFASQVAGAYRGQIRKMSQRFGGYADFWNYCAERLVEDPPPGEDLAYPLWESPLWEDWILASNTSGSNLPQIQSGPLSRVKL